MPQCAVQPRAGVRGASPPGPEGGDRRFSGESDTQQHTNGITRSVTSSSARSTRFPFAQLFPVGDLTCRKPASTYQLHVHSELQADSQRAGMSLRDFRNQLQLQPILRRQVTGEGLLTAHSSGTALITAARMRSVIISGGRQSLRGQRLGMPAG